MVCIWDHLKLIWQGATLHKLSKPCCFRPRPSETIWYLRNYSVTLMQQPAQAGWTVEGPTVYFEDEGLPSTHKSWSNCGLWTLAHCISANSSMESRVEMPKLKLSMHQMHGSSPSFACHKLFKKSPKHHPRHERNRQSCTPFMRSQWLLV